MEQIFITDLDGTLLNSSGYLSYESEQILQDISAGSLHKVGFATARGLTSAAKVIQQVSWNFPVVLNNGAVIYDWQAQRILKIKGIEAAYVEIVLKLGKENAIAYLQEHYAIQGKDLHLFGDNLNDKGMLELQANTYAVGNAHPVILALAQHKIPTNDQDGVAQTIKRVVNQAL
ncbi:HAD family hydrolase [Myroides sp. TSA_177.3]|uniref:HAD family hydrolase n=1 Tax=Myroides sp. TSA_177.3 TaxID=3415650 RepID=UPI00404559A6